MMVCLFVCHSLRHLFNIERKNNGKKSVVKRTKDPEQVHRGTGDGISVESQCQALSACQSDRCNADYDQALRGRIVFDFRFDAVGNLQEAGKLQVERSDSRRTGTGTVASARYENGLTFRYRKKVCVRQELTCLPCNMKT